jgi:biotin synthase
MVTATHGPSRRDLDVICEAAKRIKRELDLSLCASLGFLTRDKADRLKAAGVDRFNHNLETGERHFANVVTTHGYGDRVATLRIAKAAGLETCSGGIIGMGESDDDVVDLAFALRELEANSVPVNFLDARAGTPLGHLPRVEPEHALRVLAMFRFLHPRADLRLAGGREVTLRSLQPLALYAVNSIFTEGYLTTGGASASDDHRMIRDMGFEIEIHGAHAPEPRPPARVHLPVA